MIVDPRLSDWATERQCKFINLVNETGSYRKASVQLGLSHDVVRLSLKRLADKAAIHGYSPAHDMLRTVPDVYNVKRRSQYFLEGQLHSEWVISSPDDEKRFIAIQSAIEAASKSIPPREPINSPTLTNPSLCNSYIITDAHVGMLVTKTVSGSRDWNLEVAQDVLYGCFADMIARSPNAAVGVLAQIGDFLHSDGLKALTPRSGHLLDVACTYEQMVNAGVEVLIRIVDLMLTKHERVHLVMGEGNHDESGSAWLRVIFRQLYKNEPRVTVEASEVPYYAFEFGKVMLAYHHGHLRKIEQLPLIFASRFPEIWGRTKKRYGHTGHYHHEKSVGEENGMKMLQHPTLAPNDNHSARGGYDSINQARATTYHAEFGEVGSTVSCPEMLLAA